MRRGGFAIRLDSAGKRVTGGKAADCETYVTEYLRDRIADLEDQLKRSGGRGGGDGKLRQQVADMEAETRAAVRQAAEVDRLRQELQLAHEQIEVLQPLAEHHNPGLAQRLDRSNQSQARVLDLERQLKVATRERELGVSAVAGTVSQQKYDELVATNQQLQQQLQRMDGGMGSHADLQELQAVKREVLQLKRERDDLHQQYEESVLTIRQLRESAPGSAVTDGFGNAATIKELRDKLAQLIVENKRLHAAAEGAQKVMLKAQEHSEAKAMEVQRLQSEMDSEINAARHNLEQITQDYDHQRNSMQMKMQEQQRNLDEQLKMEKEDKVMLQSMLEELANNLDQTGHQLLEWQQRADRAERDLREAHRLAGVDSFAPHVTASHSWGT